MIAKMAININKGIQYPSQLSLKSWGDTLYQFLWNNTPKILIEEIRTRESFSCVKSDCLSYFQFYTRNLQLMRRILCLFPSICRYAASQLHDTIFDFPNSVVRRNCAVWSKFISRTYKIWHCRERNRGKQKHNSNEQTYNLIHRYFFINSLIIALSVTLRFFATLCTFAFWASSTQEVKRTRVSISPMVTDKPFLGYTNTLTLSSIYPPLSIMA